MLKIKHQRTADCVVAGFRWHKNGPGTHIGSLLLGLFDDDGHAPPRRASPRRSPGTGAPRWPRSWRRCARTRSRTIRGASGPSGPATGDADASGQRLPGATSRWNRGKDLSWEPLRTERVAEVAYDHLQGDRFRHGDDVQALAPGQAARGVPLRPARGDARPTCSRASSAARADVAVRLGLVGGGWISRLHLEALERLGRTELVGVVAGRARPPTRSTARWGGTRYDDVDAMLTTAKPDVVYVAVPPHRAVADRRAAGRGPDPVPDREAAGRRRRGRPGPAGGRRSSEPARRRRRLPPAGARHHGRGPRAAGRPRRRSWSSRAGWIRRRARPGGAGRRGRRPGHRAGDPPVRPRALPGRRGDRRRGGLDPRPRCLAADGGRRRQHARRSSASRTGRSGRSPTRGGSPRPSSRSSSSRTGSSRR